MQQQVTNKLHCVSSEMLFLWTCDKHSDIGEGGVFDFEGQNQTFILTDYKNEIVTPLADTELVLRFPDIWETSM